MNWWVILSFFGYDFRDFDFGGVVSFIITLILIIIFYKRFWEFLKKDILNDTHFINNVLSLILVAIGLIAIWLSVRVSLLLCYNFLFINDYAYSQYQILNLISYLLMARLCFTIIKTTQHDLKIEDFLDVTVQAVLIGIITFLPTYGNPSLLKLIGGVDRYALILVSMVIVLFVLIYTKKQYKNSNQGKPSSDN